MNKYFVNETPLARVAVELEARKLNATIHPMGENFVVWLSCGDDPAMGIFYGEGPTLAEAMNSALAHWDGYVLGTAINPDVPS